MKMVLELVWLILFLQSMYGKHESESGPVIFFSSLPALNELCVLHVAVLNTNSSVPTTPSASKFQPQIIRCRYKQNNAI